MYRLIQFVKLLDVYLTDKLSIAERIEETVDVCNQRLYSKIVFIVYVPTI